MTDELDRMKAAIREGATRSDPSVQARNVNAAMAAFDKEFSARPQESQADARPTPDAAPLWRRLTGRLSMTQIFPQLSVRKVMMGGAAMATVLIAVAFVQNVPDGGDDIPGLILPNTLDPEVKTSADRRTRYRLRLSDDMSSPAPSGEIVGGRDASSKASDPARANLGEVDEMAASGGVVRRSLREAPAVRQALKAEEESFRTAGRAEISGVLERQPAPGLAATSPPPAMRILPEPSRPVAERNTERYPDYAENPIKSTAAAPVSTFSIDVDTASYGVVRSSLKAGQTPPPEAVRVEELINYFPYDYAGPEDATTPFQANVSVFPSPWKPTNRLIHIGIKGYEIAPEDRPRANLVFLIDSSGSMNQPNKLPLLVNSFGLLLQSLDPEDTVAIVTYAGSAGVVLEPTEAKEKRKILAALQRLHAGGSTAGGAGLQLAYALAEENFDAEGVNRVILATDGDFNVGVSDPERLKTFVEEKRQTGVQLSVLGFGRGNYNDTLMQTLAQNGDGTAAYIDTFEEAQKVMVEEASSTLFTIAKDVKIQVEFNPLTVSEYRLIGYETRALKREDFNNDKVDAGEIGAGHRVTAIYEITPVGAPGAVDPLRYGAEDAPVTPVVGSEQEFAFLKMRYKLPGEDTSTLVTRPILVREAMSGVEAASTDARFATAVAGFGQLLRGGGHMGGYGYDDVFALANDARGADPFGYRVEFTRLVRLAKSAAAGLGASTPGRTNNE